MIEGNKLYKITFNSFKYDTYDSFIVIAKDEEDVVAQLHKEHDTITGVNFLGEPSSFESKTICWENGYEINEVKLDEAKILLGSFNAG